MSTHLEQVSVPLPAELHAFVAGAGGGGVMANGLRIGMSVPGSENLSPAGGQLGGLLRDQVKQETESERRRRLLGLYGGSQLGPATMQLLGILGGLR
jgi:hypothetical protein